MKVNTWFGGILVAGATLCGCTSPDPTTLPQGNRDQAVFLDQGASDHSEQRQKVAISVSEQNLKNAAKEAAAAIDSQLYSALSDFAFFEVVERSNLSALLKEKEVNSLSDAGVGGLEIQGSRYLISAKVNSIQTETRRITEPNTDLLGRPTGGSTTRDVADVKLSVDFRFYDLEDNNRVILVKNIEKSYPQLDAASVPAKIGVAAQEAVKGFATELGARFAPPARVVETRGNCQLVRISQGSNYGLVKGTKVEFFIYVDNSAIIANATRDPSLIGKGTVVSSELGTAWIEVENYQNVHVMKGHYARINADQSKGFKESLLAF